MSEPTKAMKDRAREWCDGHGYGQRTVDLIAELLASDATDSRVCGPDEVPVKREDLRSWHEWLEKVDPNPGYFGLDHKVGENNSGCSLCAAISDGEQ